MSDRVRIVASVRDGERFLADFIGGLGSQSHTAWELLVRDDGSTDGTVAAIRRHAESDRRIVLLPLDGDRLGIARSFGRLVRRDATGARWTMTADVDDVWLPHKIERTLDAMRRAESAYGVATPLLVHTDMRVADHRLHEVHRSFWQFIGVDPEPATLRRQVIRNLAAAPTLMLNAALCARIGEVPAAALFQDWWFGLVAVTVGRVVALHEATVLYRQHDRNAVGARDGRVSMRGLPGSVARALGSVTEFRSDLRRSTAQAAAFLELYGEALGSADREFLERFIRIPDLPFFARKRAALRYRVFPGGGLMRALGVLLRA